MTVGGGGSCAHGDLCGIGIFTREINDLPYKRGWAVRTDGAGNVGYEIYKARWDKSKPIGGEAAP